MKTDSILLELEAVKENFAAQANGDTRRFLDQMEAWTVAHPHAGPVVNSPEELQARLRARDVEPLPPRRRSYEQSSERPQTAQKGAEHEVCRIDEEHVPLTGLGGIQ